MKIPVYNQTGEEVGQALLPKEIFDVSLNADLLHQVVVSQQSNRRQVLANTKGRGEVSGGGRKPWRQKGTGRARVGSIRSPLWRGGGIAFGPTKEIIFTKKINRKMRRLALLMALSAKAKNNLLVVLDGLKLENPKTKLMVEILKKLPCKTRPALIALPELDRNVVRAARNIPGIQTAEARNLNPLDLLSVEYLVMPKESIKTIKENFLK
ncbi:MAG: 50S ribosomal protein L4 [Candidatus Nealsonbacteria bacterium]|nr:50S ribosomal protein L4 [Candidatus Nealsonbacteria bacterium]